MRYGKFGSRLLAWIIDTVLVSTGSAILVVVASTIYGCRFHAEGTGPFGALVTGLIRGWFLSLSIPLIVSWLYSAVCESSGWEATPGKLMAGLKVTDVSEQRISFIRASVRFFSKFLSTALFTLGWFMPLFTQHKQTLHDKIAGTVVLETPVS